MIWLDVFLTKVTTLRRILKVTFQNARKTHAGVNVRAPSPATRRDPGRT